MFGLLVERRWSVCMSKSNTRLCVSFSRTDAGLCIYHFFVWSNLNFLHISQWITLSAQSCLVLYSFCANLLPSFIMWLAVSFLSPHSLHLLFCWVLSIIALIWLVLTALFCAAIRRDSYSSSSYYYYYYYYLLLKSFSHQRQLMVFHRSLSDRKSTQVSRTLLSILASLNNAVMWIASARPPTSKSSSPFDSYNSKSTYHNRSPRHCINPSGDSIKSTIYNWYYRPFHIPQLFSIP